MKHFFFLILNTHTYETYYNHGGYKNVEELKESIAPDERLIKVWEVSKVVQVK